MGKAYDEEAYTGVLAAAALGADLAMLPAGDQSEIGTAGSTAGRQEHLTHMLHPSLPPFCSPSSPSSCSPPVRPLLICSHPSHLLHPSLSPLLLSFLPPLPSADPPLFPPPLLNAPPSSLLPPPQRPPACPPAPAL